MLSCCGEADAHWADSFEVEDGRYVAIITDERSDGPLTRFARSGDERRSTRVRLCWRQHCLKDDFDELLRKGQPRYADQIAGAPRPRHGVGFFVHLARDRKRRIDIEDIERLFHHVVEVAPKRARSFAALA